MEPKWNQLEATYSGFQRMEGTATHVNPDAHSRRTSVAQPVVSRWNRLAPEIPYALARWKRKWNAGGERWKANMELSPISARISNALKNLTSIWLFPQVLVKFSQQMDLRREIVFGDTG